jgi:hypothetical protein
MSRIIYSLILCLGLLTVSPMSSAQTPAEKSTVFLTCVLGQGAIYVGYRLGVCVDSSKRIYNLTGNTLGISLGAKGSIVFGIVKSFNRNLRGMYSSWSVGGAAVTAAINLGKLLTNMNAGLGADIISGTSASGNSLILIGPALGAMIDLSAAKITLD